MMTSTGLTFTLKVKVTSGKLSLYSWDHILVHPKKKLSRECLRVRPDTNADADANRSKIKNIEKPGDAQNKKYCEVNLMLFNFKYVL